MSATTIRHRWLLVLAVLVYAIAFQGTRGLYSPDEGRYTNVALNMLDSGDWLRPMLHPEVEHWSNVAQQSRHPGGLYTLCES